MFLHLLVHHLFYSLWTQEVILGYLYLRNTFLGNLTKEKKTENLWKEIISQDAIKDIMVDGGKYQQWQRLGRR